MLTTSMFLSLSLVIATILGCFRLSFPSALSEPGFEGPRIGEKGPFHLCDL